MFRVRLFVTQFEFRRQANKAASHLKTTHASHTQCIHLPLICHIDMLKCKYMVRFAYYGNKYFKNYNFYDASCSKQFESCWKLDQITASILGLIHPSHGLFGYAIAFDRYVNFTQLTVSLIFLLKRRNVVSTK